MPDMTYPVELTPPDIEPYRKGNTGIEYVTTFDSGKPGPHVAVLALTHGNEICGAIAVDRLFKLGVKPAHGRLSLAFSNVGAFKTFDPKNPSASRFIDEDINRVWDSAYIYHQSDTRHPAVIEGDKLLPDMERPGDRYLQPGERDFIAMIARS